MNTASQIASDEAKRIVQGICPVEVTVEKQKPTDDFAWIGQTFTLYPDVAIGMLLLLYPDSPWHLFAIDPLQRDLFGFTKRKTGEYKPKHTTGGLFNRHNARECAKQIIAWQRRGLNVYLHVNELAEVGSWQFTHRGTRDQLSQFVFVHSDVDPHADEPTHNLVIARVRSAYERMNLRPTLLVGSGYGVHPWLRLKSPIIADGKDGPNTKRVEAINKAHSFQLGVDVTEKAQGKDPCWDVSRVLKIAGLISFPNAVKLKSGKQPMPVTLLEYNAESTPAVDELESLFAVSLHPTERLGLELENGRHDDQSASHTCSDAVTPIASVEELNQYRIPTEVKRLIVDGWSQESPTPVFTPWYKRKRPDWKPADWSRSDAVYFLIGHLIAKRVPEGIIVHVLTCKDFKISGHCNDNGGESKAREQIEKWRGDPAHAQSNSAPQQFPPDAVLVDGGKIAELEETAERLLMQHGEQVYQRGPMLIRPVRLDESEADKLSASDGVRRRAGSSVLLDVTPRWIVRTLARISQWFVQGLKDKKRIDPPLEVALHVLDNKGEWLFPVLKGITTTPTLRDDGTVLQTPGYDPHSRMIFDPGSVVFPSVPDNPSIEDARAALAKFDPIFAGFPFVSDADRSVHYAALFTAIVRPALRTAPLFGYSAPAAGTGKTKLCECVGALALGVRPPVINTSTNDEEFEKRLATVIVKGDQIVFLDNVSRPLRGDVLCSMLTSPEAVSIRILGQTRDVVCPCNATVVASGNNLQLQGDVCRRGLICHLDANCEQPETRKFDFDPVAEVLNHRVDLVVAVLTCLRAYIVAGRPLPEHHEPFGSFEDMDLIRGALIWLGKADPCTKRAETSRNDETRESFIEALDEWHRAVGDELVTLKDLRDRWMNNQERFRSLIEALKDVTGLSNESGFNPKLVGNRLRSRKNTIASGFKLEQPGLNRNKVAVWRVMRVERQTTFDELPQAETNPTRAETVPQPDYSGVTVDSTGWEGVTP